MEQFFTANKNVRVLGFFSGTMMLALEFSRTRNDVGITEIELGIDKFKLLTTDRDHIKKIIDRAKFIAITTGNSIKFPMDTPSGKTLILDEDSIELLELVLNQPDDDIIFEHMAKDHRAISIGFSKK